MEAAVSHRRVCRHKLPKTPCGAVADSTSFSARKTEADWKALRPLQSKYLKSELAVIRLAIAGHPISDYFHRCKTARQAPSRDLAYEIEQMFPLAVARPATRLRGLLNKHSVSHQRAAWARKVIIAMLKTPIATFFEIADLLAENTLQNVGKRNHHRIRAALTRMLMYLSDCWRYTLDHAAAKNAAQMLQVFSPDDPEAHLRLAMNLSMLCNGNQAIRPFYHFCVFLANRKVDVMHQEATVVTNFVQGLSRHLVETPEQRPVLEKRHFFAILIETLWTLLGNDLEKATDSVRRVPLWESTECFMQQSVSAEEMMNIVGAVMFVHHRCSPKGSPGGKLLPQCELADYLVGRFIHIACLKYSQTLHEVYIALQKRKKNRRRAMQKKRRANSNIPDRDKDVALGYEVFTEKVDIDAIAPSLGAISFLAHYWSKSRAAPSPTLKMKPLGRTLKALQDVNVEFEKIEKLTCTGPLANHIENKILDGHGGRIPAMSEDLKFCHFLPCQDQKMFHQTAFHEVPLAAILQKTEEGIIKPALKSIGDQSHESLVAMTAERHLEAFSVRAAKEVMIPDSILRLERPAACNLVCMTIRKCRIRRLVRDLEKVGGGHLRRMSLESSCEQAQEEAVVTAQEAEQLPSPGQPRASIADLEDNFHEPITPGQLGAQVRKRRRLLGTCTASVMQSPMPASQSNPSSGDRVLQGDRTTQDSARTYHSVLPPPKVGEKRTRDQQRQIGTPMLRRSYGGILSQGSLQLSYAQPAQLRGHQTSSKQPLRNQPSQLYLILRNFLYPPQVESCSTPGETDCPAWWRRSPSDEMSQNIFSSQPLSSDG